jgi:tetratricopeptide (TPR) repeat protein
MRAVRLALIVAPALVVAACAARTDKRTLASLHQVSADTREVQVDKGLDQAMQGYRRFLDETPENNLTPEAMRRLADLKVEKEYGILGDGKLVELPAAGTSAKADSGTADTVPIAKPKAGSMQMPAPVVARKIDARTAGRKVLKSATPATSENDLEQRATAQQPLAASADSLALPEGVDRSLERAGPLEAIKLYDELLAKYPSYPYRDQVLYQKARAYDELGRTAESLKVMEQLIAGNPLSRYVAEVQFRRAEHFFARKKYRDAEAAYTAIVGIGTGSEYYELALYKLGWTLYKQDFYEEALHRYIALLDYKVSSGYDFDAKHPEPEERRIEDTFQVISLSFSSLGGPEVIGEYFSSNGHRVYEDRVYRNFGEFYLGKLRYNDAATVYKSFVALYPLHAVAPRFSMRVIEIYEVGGFPKLVLESKKAFAANYGLRAEYWQHFDIAKAPEVVSYLKTNLKDLANHYHAQYQDANQEKEKPANYAEASRWYREFLISFHGDPEAPPINYQLADLLRENRDYAAAAREYERTAYDYPPHEKAAAAGYAAIYAHRENLKVVSEEAKEAAKRDTVNSSLKFADTFPQHEQAAVVLGAAAQDLYDMKDFALARTSARKLIDNFPNAAPPVRRTAWLVVAHSSFDLADYQDAEAAYGRVLEATPEGDDSRPALVENLAASIYKQGEKANEAGDYRTAANHFLRVKEAAPTSKIRASAEYDAGAALIRLQDWTAAGQVLDAFRRAYPEHELQKEATKQIAFVYRQAGQLSQSAGEYERVATESNDPKLRAEALLVAGDLYEQSKSMDRALDVYSRYVQQFPKPLDAAVETRFKIAEISKSRNDEARYQHELQEIVRIDAAAGGERTGRTRNLGARSALVLSEQIYNRFAAMKLTQPFERSLQEKQRSMNTAIQAFNNLVGYEVGEVTAAATFYIAEVYSNFSRSLIESERPSGLKPAAVQKYADQLEEEAFPFEEKAIQFHEKNLELIAGGLYNAWTEKSLARLAVLKPGRYAKAEISSGFLGSLDRYVYRQPARSADAVVTGQATGSGQQPSASGSTASPGQSPPASGPTAGPGESPSASGPTMDAGQPPSAGQSPTSSSLPAEGAGNAPTH